MKVLIATGGTGGHIYPALALADTLKKERPDAEVVFFGSSNRMEAKAIPEAGYRFFGTEMAGLTGGTMDKIKAISTLIRAEKYCRKLIRQEQPDVVAAFGNYISVPIVRAAKSAGIPVLLHEQNSFAGKANKFLARYADVIVCCYESNRKQFPPEKIRMYGNPEAGIAAETEWDPSVLTDLGLDPQKPFVVFMMGSLGSASVSSVIDEACSLFDPDYQVVIAAGKSNDYEFRYQSDDRIVIVPYVDGKKMLKGCALAVTRAGATTIAEIGGIGCASILIPSPYVANNHQVFNAMELVRNDAAVMIEEKDLTSQKLAESVNALMKNPERRNTIRKNAKALGKTDAGIRMIECMEELTRNG